MTVVSPSPGASDLGTVFGGGDGRRERSRLVSAISVLWSFLALLGLCVTVAVVVAVVGKALLTELLG